MSLELIKNGEGSYLCLLVYILLQNGRVSELSKNKVENGRVTEGRGIMFLADVFFPNPEWAK